MAKKESLVHWTKRFYTGKLTRAEWDESNTGDVGVVLNALPVSQRRKARARKNMWKVYQKTWGNVGKDIKFYKKKFGVK